MMVTVALLALGLRGYIVPRCYTIELGLVRAPCGGTFDLRFLDGQSEMERL